ncbi:MAG: type IV secretion system protein [Helicobacter sp.]|nr:type IV secretion system protein [Helicobacter sp.]MCI5968696.1 type IV secretion system protein [Helicobacter sp.]
MQGNYNIKADTALLKSIISGYVLDRETINRINDEERYRKIASQSENKVWKAFERLVTQRGSIYTTPNLYREIEIINTSILSKNVALVDFIATTQQGVVKNISRFRVSIQYDFINREITQESVPNNPTGFIVKEYQATKINIENQNTTQEKKQETPLENNQTSKTENDTKIKEAILDKKD